MVSSLDKLTSKLKSSNLVDIGKNNSKIEGSSLAAALKVLTPHVTRVSGNREEIGV